MSIDPYSQDPSDDMSEADLIEGAGAFIDFGEDGIADWIGAIVERRETVTPLPDPSDPMFVVADSIVRAEVILDVLRQVTADYEAHLAELRAR